MSLAVLNPGGRDRQQSYLAGSGSPEDTIQPPIGVHSYAACCKGGLYRDAKAIPASVQNTLLLLTKNNLRRALASLRYLKVRGVSVRVAFRESREQDIAELLGDVTRHELFCEICREATGAIANTPLMAALFKAAGATDARVIAPPCPIDFPEWDFSQPLEKRRGIFIGTQSFSDSSQHHAIALMLANRISIELACPLAVLNSEGRQGGMILKSIQKTNPLLFIVEGPLDYPDFLRLMALHRIVWHLNTDDDNIATAALLCRMPCVGGTGMIARTAFPKLSAPATLEKMESTARTLLTRDTSWKEAVDDSQARATESLSFAITASLLQSNPSQ